MPVFGLYRMSHIFIKSHWQLHTLSMLGCSRSSVFSPLLDPFSWWNFAESFLFDLSPSPALPMIDF